eukprot:scaffold3820_cov415-Prasinococcus_capsulatus_cf.AAC.10
MSNDKECPQYGMAKVAEDEDVAAAAAAQAVHQAQDANLVDIYAGRRKWELKHPSGGSPVRGGLSKEVVGLMGIPWAPPARVKQDCRTRARGR